MPRFTLIDLDVSPHSNGRHRPLRRCNQVAGAVVDRVRSPEKMQKETQRNRSKNEKKAVNRCPPKIVTFSNLNARRKQCEKFTKTNFSYEGYISLA